MNNTTLISVVVPCYNVENYLDEALTSVFKQTYANWECIMINDGSQDNTAKIAKEWSKKDNRFKYIYQENLGLSGARNTGLINAKGEFIYFFDSDDLLDTDALNNLYSLVKPNCDIVFGLNATVNGQNSSIISLMSHTPENLVLHTNENKQLLNLVINEPLICVAWNKLYRKSFLNLNNLTFKEGLLHEDELWFFQTLYHAKSIILNDKATYFYNVGNVNSITNNFNLKNLESYLTIIQEIYSNYYKKDSKNRNTIATYITYLQQVVINHGYSKLPETDKITGSQLINKLFTNISFTDYKPTVCHKLYNTYLEFQDVSHLKPEKIKRFLKYSRSNKISRKIKKKLLLYKALKNKH